MCHTKAQLNAIMPYTANILRASPRAMLALTILVPVSGFATDLASQAAVLTADVPHGLVLYIKHCQSCDGRNAWGDGPRAIPALAGQREGYLIGQMAHFVDGDRPGSELHGPAMHDILQPSDVNRAQALRDLAAWLSRASPNRDPEHGEGERLSAGKRAYANACSGCHGTNGEGGVQPTVPVLAGQHYSYLLAQLRDFSSGRLAHAPGVGVAALASAEQQQAIADYLSRLTLVRPANE